MIDTLKVSEQLQESGLNYEQSKSIATAISSNNEELATKQDIQSVRWLVGISLLLNTLAISGIIALLVSVANL